MGLEGVMSALENVKQISDRVAQIEAGAALLLMAKLSAHLPRALGPRARKLIVVGVSRKTGRKEHTVLVWFQDHYEPTAVPKGTRGYLLNTFVAALERWPDLPEGADPAQALTVMGDAVEEMGGHAGEAARDAR